MATQQHREAARRNVASDRQGALRRRCPSGASRAVGRTLRLLGRRGGKITRAHDERVPKGAVI